MEVVHAALEAHPKAANNPDVRSSVSNLQWPPRPVTNSRTMGLGISSV